MVAMIGGGGKSTLIQRLADELTANGLTVILSTTTKLQRLQGTETVLLESTPHYQAVISDALKKSGRVLVAKEVYGDRLKGFEDFDFQGLRELADTVLIEADGCRQRPLKAHKPYEPVIPPTATDVVVLCGADAVDQPLNDHHVHRAELFAEKWALPLNTTLRPEIIARELTADSGHLRRVPHATRTVFYVNKSDLNPDGARRLAAELRHHTTAPVFWGSLRTQVLQPA